MKKDLSLSNLLKKDVSKGALKQREEERFVYMDLGPTCCECPPVSGGFGLWALLFKERISIYLAPAPPFEGEFVDVDPGPIC